MKTWFSITTPSNLADDTAEVRIYDNIGDFGVSAKQFCESFAGIKAAKIDLRINSYGGEVFDAAAMCTAIREHSATVTAHVDGIAASAASVVAAACDSVTMGKSAFLMIHNPLTMAYGNADEMRKQADVLDKLADSIAAVYCDKTGKTKEQVTKAMNAETWFNADEAKAFGLADTIKDDDEDDVQNHADGKLGRVINSLAPLLVTKYKNVPDRIRQLAHAGGTQARNAGGEQSRTEKANAMLKIINRDGKSFVNIGGKEHEVQPVLDPQTATIVNTAKPGKTDEEVATTVTAAVNKAKEDAIKEERAYRTLFSTITNSAGLSAEGAAEFEKNFYGRAETDLKFLASHAIGQRATAVGEGGGSNEPENKTAADKAKAEIVAYCTNRFAKEPSLRRSFKVGVSNAADPSYQAGLQKFITVETKSRADWAKPTNHAHDDEPSGDDPISKVLKNKSVYGGT